MNIQKGRLFLIAGLLAIVAYFVVRYQSDSSNNFPNLVGPTAITAIPTEPPRTRPDQFTGGSTDSIALWIKDPNSSWLGLVQGLQSVGVPFKIYTEPEGIFRHDVILAYPSVTGSNTDPSVLSAMADHVQNGGTLLAFSVIGGGLPRIFGFEDSVETANLSEIQWGQGPTLDKLQILPRHKRIPLIGTSGKMEGLPGMIYRNLKCEPIASFSDGQGAITFNSHDAGNGKTGYAYAIGIDLGHFILRAHNGRFTGISATYVNAYQPIIDHFLLWLKAVYIQGEPDAVTLWPTAYNKEFTALITHDIDFTQSILNVKAYMDVELKEDVPATYFLQTKYVKDWNDDIFFTPDVIPSLLDLEKSGMEIASHTVSHSNEFQHMPAGTGMESYPQYQPKVMTFTSQTGGSILGELRVSKFMLESLLKVKVRSFRPGHLSYPRSLPQMLATTGYDFSTSMTANEALTHFPFRLMYNRSYEAELDVLEIPVTIEDEKGRLGDRLQESIELAEQIGGYGGVVNLLIHTETKDHKLKFEQDFITHFRDRAWYTTVSGFGDWWRARDAVQVKVKSENNRRLLWVKAPIPIKGLTLELPSQWHLSDKLEGWTLEGNRLVIESLDGEIEIPLINP